jgi:glycosyltransferase involved in cell wall biosynthesis
MTQQRIAPVDTDPSSPPLVSVVIPAFNARHFLRESLESVQVQTYPRIETVVVDDGSTDNTAEWLASEFPQIRCVRQRNSGACSAPRNAGAYVATGSVLVFLDADDVMLPYHIENLVEALQQGDNTIMGISNYQNFDHETGGDIGSPHFRTVSLLAREGGMQRTGKISVLPGSVARRILALENFSIASALAMRRSSFFELGGFDESLSASEDYDLVFRATRLGDLAIVGDVGFRRRMHNANMSSQVPRIIGQKISSRAKLLVDEEDGIARARLEETLVELYIAKAGSRKVFTRHDRLKALISAFRLRPRLDRRYLRVAAKIFLA